MKMNKIESQSRFYKGVDKLNIILFHPSVSDFPILIEDYKNQINSVSVSETLFKIFENILDSEPFTEYEKTLLIEKFILKLNIIGKHPIGLIDSRIELIKKLGIVEKNKTLLKEYKKTYDSINDIRCFVQEKLKIKYQEILTSSNLNHIENNDKTESTKDFPEIFTEGNYNKFVLLNEKYKKDNKSLKAKYSNIYHFMDYEDMLCCTQSEYIDFIVVQKFTDNISKIQPQTNKYKDIIKPLLMRYLKGQS
jgi:hypothetical protein